MKEKICVENFLKTPAAVRETTVDSGKNEAHFSRSREQNVNGEYTHICSIGAGIGLPYADIWFEGWYHVDPAQSYASLRNAVGQCHPDHGWGDWVNTEGSSRWQIELFASSKDSPGTYRSLGFYNGEKMKVRSFDSVTEIWGRVVDTEYSNNSLYSAEPLTAHFARNYKS